MFKCPVSWSPFLLRCCYSHARLYYWPAHHGGEHFFSPGKCSIIPRGSQVYIHTVCVHIYTHILFFSLCVRQQYCLFPTRKNKQILAKVPTQVQRLHSGPVYQLVSELKMIFVASLGQTAYFKPIWHNCSLRRLLLHHVEPGLHRSASILFRSETNETPWNLNPFNADRERICLI